MQEPVAPKVSAYTKRNTNSIAAPMEIDSDPDFNPGFIEPEKKTKKKRGKRRPQNSGDSDDSGNPRKKKRKTRDGAEGPKRRLRGRPNESGPNPLLEFFANMDLHSDSSEDEPGPMEGPSLEAADDRSDADAPERPDKFAAFARRSLPSPSKVPAASPGSGETTDEDSSNDDVFAAAPKRKTPPGPPKCSNANSATDSEATDSDSSASGSDVFIKPVSKAAPSEASPSKTAPPEPTPDDSETEPDSDFDGLVTPEQRPRPGFPVPPGQTLLGPMVLDVRQGIKVPAAINTYLREYQRDGVKFFWERYKEGRGGLLGDDMGLGKTIQVISFLSAIMKKNGVRTDRNRRRKHVSALQDKPEWRKNKTLPPANETWPTCLIIAPATVVMNWEREFETWGYFEVGNYVGTPEERGTVLKDFKKGRLDVVLTSIDLARRDIALLDTLPWSCVIVDEVHTVKNPNSKTSIAYNSFDCVRRFGLTGTAIQNSYDELWTILDWTSPGMLGDRKQWQGFISKPLKAGQSTAASEEERLRSHAVSQILHNKLLPRFFLRRTKVIIQHQLPKKSDEVVFCPLSNVQRSVYKRVLAMDEVQAVLHRDDPCHCGSRKPQKKCHVPFDPATIFKFMSILIKLSNHLGLIMPSPSDTPEQLIRNRELVAIAFPEGNAPTFGTAILDTQYCGKWAVLLELLKEWRGDRSNKALIFTKSVKLLEMLSFHLKMQGYEFLQLDGSTKQSDRMPMIDQFHNDPDIFIFLISTMAGGTGLNLTGANRVVIFDPNWNPAHDLQAMDRAFRFGQTRDVFVFRLLGAGSVEELIYARQVYKQQQMAIGYDASIQTRYFSGIQGDTRNPGELFGLPNIFKLHEGGLSTKTTIEKAHLAELDWALGSMDNPNPKAKKKRNPDNEIADLDIKFGKEFTDLKGLGALLFDDAPPRASQETALPKNKAIAGIYTHQNPDLLVSSKIEQERTKEMAKRRKAKKSGIPDEDEPAKPWPPPRVHKNKAGARSDETPEEKLKKRIHALVGTGAINHPSELAAFAKNFRTYTPEEQAFTLEQLNEYDRTNKDMDDEDSGPDDDDNVEAEPEDI
ncbi:P-loop containing nucleoside triphosphate hydrolase protein [Mycena sp. CBHHK59/15]|nr:P-loop containing nucleoside triphosphate hydrolase protein [Mycena sp. CBHHK59/15]